MSVQLMAAVFEQGPANPHLRLLMLAIADHADEEGVAWPSVDRLAAKCSVSARQVQRSLQQLEAEGWLVVERGRGRGNTSLYRLDVARLLGNGDARVGLCGPPKGDARSPKGDIHGTERVTPTSSEPSRGNQQEPSISAAIVDPLGTPSGQLIDVAAASEWLSRLHPDLACNARTAPPAAAALAHRISPDVARQLLQSAGHRIDRAAVVAHVLPGVIGSEVDRRRRVGEQRAAQAEAAVERRASGPELVWPEQLAAEPLSARLAWLRTPEGEAWAAAVDKPSLPAPQAHGGRFGEPVAARG